MFSIVEPIGESALNAGFLTLEKALNIYKDYLMIYPSKQHLTSTSLHSVMIL